MIGLEVHAHMLAQQLDNAWPRPIPGPALWALAVLIVVAGGLTSLIDLRARWVALAFLGQMAFFIAFPFWLQARGVDTTTLPTFGWAVGRSEEHTSELQSLMRNSYAVFCLKKKNKKQ